MNCYSCDLSIALGFNESNKDSVTRICQLLHMELNEVKKYVVYPTADFPVTERLGRFIVNHSFEPCVRGHLVVQPMKCRNSSDQIHDFEGDTIVSLFRLVGKVSRALNETLKPERIYMWSFNEQAANQLNWHLHVHVAPRNPSCLIRGPEWLFFKDKCSERLRTAEIVKIVSDIRDKLQRHMQ